MATHCFIPVLGKRIRVTPLDSCGGILDGGEYVATDGFISLTLSSEIEDGTEIITKKASGALCVNEKFADSFKRFTVEIEFCGVNPALLALVTNAKPYEDYAGDVAGFTIAEGEIQKWFALELWTGMSGVACAAGAEEASGYILLPFLTAGVLGDITIDGENAVTFTLTGAASKGGNAWGVGPYNVLADTETTPGSSTPAPLPTPLDPFDHFLLVDTAIAPPPSACEPTPVPTGIVATGATAGNPGTFTPDGADRPANLAGLTGVTASPATAWTAGQYIPLADGSKAHWNATTWVANAATLEADSETETARSGSKAKVAVPA